MKNLFLSIGFVSLVSVLTSCGSDSKKTETPATGTNTTTTLKFADVKSISDTKCVSCHNASSNNGVILLTADNWKTHKVKALSAVESGQMPPTGSIADSADGKRLIEWLKGGEDLK
jgi:uncharacterized membrane protein